MTHLKVLKKEEQTKPKTSEWREIMTIRAKIHEIETKQTVLHFLNPFISHGVSGLFPKLGLSE
jgi:hypothetical protein